MFNVRRAKFFKEINAFAAILSFIFVPLAGGNVQAQDVDANAVQAAVARDTAAFIDDTFNPKLAGQAATINRTLLQSDGKFLVSGTFNLVNNTIKNNLVRFNSDGTIDGTFNFKAGTNGRILALGLQSDGKILIGGLFTMCGGQTVNNLARLNADGTFDVSFNSNGVYYTSGASTTVNDISVLPDNRFYIGGDFTNYNGTAINRLARINPNGDIDTTFATGTGPNSTVNVIGQVAGGKILVGGGFASFNGSTAVPRLIRLNSDGTVDSSFTMGTGPNNSVRTLVFQPDGKIIVGGAFASINSVAKNGLARISADGADDATFSVSGTAAQVFSAALQPDGKLVVGGSFAAIAGTTVRAIARLNADGTFDNTFSAGTGLGNVSPFVGVTNSVALQADGRVIIGGSFTTYNGTARASIARANTDGSLDNTVNPTTSLVGNIWTVAKTSDGKVVIGGQFTAVNGAARSNVARLNADGSTDTSFDPGSGADGLVTGVGVQADGKIILGGEFTHYNGTAITGVARLNTDGTLDTSFVVGTGQGGDIYTVAFQTDGKILIGGAFPQYNSVTVNNIARLNTDGSLDTTLATGTGPNGIVRKILIQPDNKILVGGEFATFNATAKTRLTRLNADGTFDSSFVTGTISSNVKDMILEASGKIVIVGSFSTINGTARNRAARLNSDGSLDTSFDPGVGFTQDVLTIVPVDHGKYMVAGVFTTASGLSRNRIARLHNSGALDPKFLQGLGPIGATTPQIRTIVPLNGKYLIGGQFDSFNTSARSGLVLMSNRSKVPVDFDGDGITDVAIARQYGGLGRWTWWIRNSSDNTILTFDYGIFTVDGLQPGDFDGDGRTDIAVWTGRAAAGRPNGYWITFSSTNQVKFIPFGLDGDRNVLEDYDGDGKDDMAIYRAPSFAIGQGTWIYRASGNNPTGNLTYVPFGYNWAAVDGGSDDIVPGDIDGDGRADFRVQRKIDTSVTTSNTPAIFYTLSAKGVLTYDYFGWYSDRTIPGDYDGDGKDDLAIARGFNITPHTTTWYIRYTGGAGDVQFDWGAGGLDNFVQGDYDGDGIIDVAVYRRGEENNYYILRSSDQTMMVIHWGTADPLGGPASDVPIAVYNNR